MSPHPFRSALLAHRQAVVLRIIALSLLSGVAQVAGSPPATPRVEWQVSEAMPAPPDADVAPDAEAQVLEASLVYLPPASVDAISL